MTSVTRSANGRRYPFLVYIRANTTIIRFGGGVGKARTQEPWRLNSLTCTVSSPKNRFLPVIKNRCLKVRRVHFHYKVREVKILTSRDALWLHNKLVRPRFSSAKEKNKAISWYKTFVRISLTGLDHFFNSGLKLRSILTLIFTAGMFFACKEDQLKKLIHMKQESRPTSWKLRVTP